MPDMNDPLTDIASWPLIYVDTDSSYASAWLLSTEHRLSMSAHGMLMVCAVYVTEEKPVFTVDEFVRYRPYDDPGEVLCNLRELVIRGLFYPGRHPRTSAHGPRAPPSSPQSTQRAQPPTRHAATVNRAPRTHETLSLA